MPKTQEPLNDPEAQLSGFIEKFTPENQTLIREVRAALRQRLPTANELVYDNYNFFVIGYCASERPSDCIVSIAASANGISLSFYRGASLTDPDGVLQGDGAQNRFIRLENAEILARPEVDALIAQAALIGKVAPPSGGGGTLIIRSISAKQRPRRK
jgi:hypothetical protein